MLDMGGEFLMLIPAMILLPMLMAGVCFAFRRRNRAVSLTLFLVTCCLSLALSVLLLFRGETTLDLPGFTGHGLHFRADFFRAFYASLASFMWLVTGMMRPAYFRHDGKIHRYLFFNLLTLGATLGVFLSDDLFTTLVFFEIMSLASYVWVVQEEDDHAMRAGQTYLAVAVIGGLTTLMGLFLLEKELGTLSFQGLSASTARSPAVTWGVWLTLFGFAAKAGLFPLHIWLPKAHPVAPAPASALLSGMLTKTGVFGMIVLSMRLMKGDRTFGIILLLLGCATMFLGALLALFSVNLKRTLACSSVSQIGFITVGLASAVLLDHEATLAVSGTVLHMVNHSLIKLCLFLCAGCVFMNTEELDLNRIRGFGRHKPLFHAVFLMGALSLACLPPLGSGFNSKSLIHEGLLEWVEVVREEGGPAWAFKSLEILFLVSGGLTIAYMTKLYVCLFLEKNRDAGVQSRFDGMRRYARPLSAAALLLSGCLLPVLGLFGSVFMTPIAHASTAFFQISPVFHPMLFFTPENLKGAGESLAIGILVYFALVRPWMTDHGGTYLQRWPVSLDLEDRVYRPILAFLPRILSFPVRLLMGIGDWPLIRRWIPRAVSLLTGWIMILPDRLRVPRFIPAFFRFAMRLPDSLRLHRLISFASTAFSRLFMEFPDHLAFLCKRSFLAIRRTRTPPHVGTRFTYALGMMLNRIAHGLNRTLLRHHPMRDDFEYVLDASHQEASREASEIGQSFSFGLFLMCAGLITVILVVLLHR